MNRVDFRHRPSAAARDDTQKKFIPIHSDNCGVIMKCDGCNQKVSKKGKQDKCNQFRTECEKVQSCIRWNQ